MPSTLTKIAAPILLCVNSCIKTKLAPISHTSLPQHGKHCFPYLSTSFTSKLFKPLCKVYCFLYELMVPLFATAQHCVKLTNRKETEGQVIEKGTRERVVALGFNLEKTQLRRRSQSRNEWTQFPPRVMRVHVSHGMSVGVFSNH